MFRHIKKRHNEKNEIKEIMKKSGWDAKKVEERLIEVSELGMSRKRFLYNNGWEYSNEELIKLNSEIETIMKEEKYKLSTLKNESKRLKEEIVGRKIQANKVGISDQEYYDNKLYKLSSKDFEKILSSKK